MKRIIILYLLVTICRMCYSQTMSDIGKIIIGIDIPSTSSQYTLEQKDYLQKKVSHWLAQAGFSANGITTFYVIPEISIDHEDMAEAGMKNVYVIQGTLYLKILQCDKEVVFSSISLPFRESSTSPSLAIKNGINKLQFSKIIPVLDQAKSKIISYYESEKNNIFAHADMLAKGKKYDAAIAHLLTIPDCLGSIYLEALDKADMILDLRTKVYNDSILVMAQSFLAEHNAHSALDVLCDYQPASTGQDTEYAKLLVKAEELVTAEELAVAREKRQLYLDKQEKERRQWEAESIEREHRIDMERQQMAYNRETLASSERLASQRIDADERITGQKIASSERLVSQGIAANERLTSQRISALKSVAVEYFRNNQTRTTIIQHRY